MNLYYCATANVEQARRYVGRPMFSTCPKAPAFAVGANGQVGLKQNNLFSWKFILNDPKLYA